MQASSVGCTGMGVMGVQGNHLGREYPAACQSIMQEIGTRKLAFAPSLPPRVPRPIFMQHTAPLPLKLGVLLLFTASLSCPYIIELLNIEWKTKCG